nr:hypothetical protein [Paenibacillus taihuensis]
MELLGGEIRVYSQTGQGSRFEVDFPANVRRAENETS